MHVALASQDDVNPQEVEVSESQGRLREAR